MQRLANMAANAQQMPEFGLHEAAQSVRPKAKAVQPPRPRCMQQLSCASRAPMASVTACMSPSDSADQSCMPACHGCASPVMIRVPDSHDFKPPSSRVLRLQASAQLNGAGALKEVRKVSIVVGTHVQQGWISVQLLRGMDRQLAEACTMKRSTGPWQVHATQASALVIAGRPTSRRLYIARRISSMRRNGRASASGGRKGGAAHPLHNVIAFCAGFCIIRSWEGTMHTAIRRSCHRLPAALLHQTEVVPLVLRRSSGEGLKHSWAHVQPHYTQAAMDKALKEAMAFGEALGNPWNLKVRCPGRKV